MCKKILCRAGLAGMGGLMLASVLAVSVGGCRMASTDRDLILGELDSQQLVERLEAGETSREEEQAFILKSHQAWRELRAGRGLVNPTEAGPLAAEFQRARSSASTSALRGLVWAWLELAVTNPGLDLRASRVGPEVAAHERE